MFESSVLEISSSALAHNLNFIKKLLKKSVRFCSVVKGNAYGHGISEFVELAMEHGIDYFGVHSAEEAFRLTSKINVKPELFIMGYADKYAIEWAIKNQIEFAVYDMDILNTAVSFANNNRIKAKVHIEFETGMHRTGFDVSSVPQISTLLKSNQEYVKLQGVFTHFAGAENQANDFRISRQIMTFNNIIKLLQNEKLKPLYIHSACSAALLNYPETQSNMVRIGILQYGFWPNMETHIRFLGNKKNNPDLLKRVIKWQSKVMAIQEINKGSFIGYGTAYLAHKNMKLAIIPVGYSHGYNRNLSNIGAVLINGKIAPVVGTVNMNSITVDITHSGNVEKGDEVVMIGKQKNKSITINSFSEQTNQLNYELLARLPSNIPRIQTL